MLLSFVFCMRQIYFGSLCFFVSGVVGGGGLWFGLSLCYLVNRRNSF